MKYLFFLLLFINIVVFLWVGGVGRPQTPAEQSDPPTSPAVERIVLIKELAKIPVKGQEPPINSPDKLVPGPALPTPQNPPGNVHPVAKAPEENKEEACHRLGPYASQSQSQAALNALGRNLGRVNVIKMPTEVVNGYFILYPSDNTLQAAQSNRRMLQKKGYPGAWVVDAGENHYAVSLALVRNKDRADEAINRYRARGIPVELKPRKSLVDKWWLEIRGTADRATLEAFASQSNRGAETTELKTCD